MARYHMRRADREIKDPDELLRLIENGVYVTIALCRNDNPYLVTVNYSFDRSKRCLYFHAAREGLKMDFIKSNPRVWCQVLEDMGYVAGECEWDYRTVHISGSARIVDDMTEKRHALDLMIDKLEDHPEAVKKKHIDQANLEKVRVCRIDIAEMYGKESKRKH